MCLSPVVVPIRDVMDGVVTSAQQRRHLRRSRRLDRLAGVAANVPLRAAGALIGSALQQAH